MGLERRKLWIGRRKHRRWQIERSTEQRFGCSRALGIRNLFEATGRENRESVRDERLAEKIASRVRDERLAKGTLAAGGEVTSCL